MKELKILQGVFAVVGGFFVSLLGGMDTLLTCLITLIVVDYITGVLKAVYNQCVSSDIGWKGIVKKIITLLIVVLAYQIEKVTGNAFPIREITVLFFIANEGISILEHAVEMGLPVPKALQDILIQLRKDYEETEGCETEEEKADEIEEDENGNG